jgi:exopolyphosphatase/guanosine-5'-triphosphate,3'-diphosphate pyrophosphatase
MINKNLPVNFNPSTTPSNLSLPNQKKQCSIQTPSFLPSKKTTFRKFLAESILATLPVQNNIERRAAIDVGSGSTKVCIADIDVRTNEIKQILFEGSFFVPYQSYLETDPNTQFNAEIQEKALAVFGNIQDLLAQHQVTHVKAIATEAFRKAGNGADFAQLVKEKTGIPLNVISQEDEGKIAFYSAVSSTHQNPDNLLIWDIGTGSFQIIAAHEDIDHKLEIYMRSMGAVPFKNYIIQEIQGKDAAAVKSPNPMTQEDWEKADALARHMGRHALPYIKEKVGSVEGHVVGIGRLFANSVKPMGTDGKIHRDDLREFIRSSLGKTDEELGDPFANVNTSNAILVLGVMKALHIHEISIIETTSTKGILSYEPYWK